MDRSNLPSGFPIRFRRTSNGPIRTALVVRRWLRLTGVGLDRVAYLVRLEGGLFSVVGAADVIVPNKEK